MNDLQQITVLIAANRIALAISVLALVVVTARMLWDRMLG